MLLFLAKAGSEKLPRLLSSGYHGKMSKTSRITLLLGAMEEVFLSHVDTLSSISEMLAYTPEEEKQELSWSLGWNMARMQEGLLSASAALCREMERIGLDPPKLDLEVEKPQDCPEEFIQFWTEHLIAQAAILRVSYLELQKEVLESNASLDEDDDFWDESLAHLLKRYQE